MNQAKPAKWDRVYFDGGPSSSEMHRLKVPGGWLVYFYSSSVHHSTRYDVGEICESHGGLTFYPDPQHQWELPEYDQYLKSLGQR